ncbi:MAG: phosphate ABC transporter substrate-binding protein [Bacteroidales bacterium]|jgi:phosphate transport system substrate-binding protein|nr:phosphate ABC transporter substrate-binding protein [Bacteroidales bacterium]
MKKTLKTTLAALIIAFAGLNVNGQKVKGSDSVLPLSQNEAQAYQKKGGNVSVTGGGSGVGIAALIDGTTDIAQSSRELKFSERAKLKSLKKDIKEVTIARDALTVIINPNNKVKKLTVEQLEKIFTGEITNWKQVGGDDMKIIVYCRESSSGTYEFFKEHVMNNKNYASSVLSLPATGAVVQSVKQTKGAIGYIGLAYVTEGIKEVEVMKDNKKFPIIRPLLYFYDVKNEKKVKPFIDFVLSSEGQNIVKQTGYLPVK